MENAEGKQDIINTSEGEELAIKARQKKVTEALIKKGLTVEEKSGPPVIAVLGSGGGSRAMVAFLGVLSKLAELNLLDLVTYVGGTSGSTWCMSSLYNNENWTKVEFLKEKEKQLFKSGFSWNTAWEKIKAAYGKEQYSLTDFWAYITVYFMTGEMFEEKLSDHKNRCEDGNLPYPVYSAVEKGTGTWCEFTPHVGGFPMFKSFVNIKHLGSKFEAGTLSKTHPEMDLSYLRGLWGSAPATDDIITYIIKELLKKLVPQWPKSKGNQPMKMKVKMLPDEEEEMRVMEDEEQGEEVQFFQEELSCDCSECAKIKQQLRWKEGEDPNTGDGEHVMARMSFPNVLQESCKVAKVLGNILSSLKKWEWGTTNGFLYKWKEEVCPDLADKQEMSLVDAGLFINTPYPLMLPPHRNVDLILSFDFSAGDPFETLSKTAEYCEKHHISFPNVDVKETSMEKNEKGDIIPLDCCYIFEGDGKGTPDVMHFPLFNNQTCEGKVTEMVNDYSTFKLNYEESEVEKLLEVSKRNVEEGYKKIEEKLKQLVERRNKMGAKEVTANGLH